MLNLFATHVRGACAALFTLLLATPLFAQTKTISRTYEPVVVEAGTPTVQPLLGASINDLTAYRYDAGSGNFFAIPFQIDELSADGEFLQESDGVVDDNDQIVFMPGDTGDRASTDKWVGDSVNEKRLELEVSDPLAATGKGWIYLFRGVANKPSVPAYVSYSRGPSTTAGTDTVKGVSYVESHDPAGWFTDVAVNPAAGGDGLDIMDRQKIRASGVYLIFTASINEQENLPFVGVRFGGGPVRGLRELALSFVFLGSALDTFTVVTQYFPYSTSFSAKGAKIPTIDGLQVKSVRQSIDLNDHASGMKFFNSFNLGNGINVDGAADQVNESLSDSPTDSLNWSLITGNPGSALVLLKVPRIGQARKLYYKDNAAVDNTDTGDKKSYADTGVLITSTGTITGSFSFDFASYYLGKNQAASIGDEFKRRALSPMQVSATEQTRTSTAVQGGHSGPLSFVLHDAQPNPFWPLRGNVRLSFTATTSRVAPALRIYNLLGQQVARFDFARAADGGTQNILWNGRSSNGELLPAGIYFYQLQAGSQISTKKLVIIR